MHINEKIWSLIKRVRTTSPLVHNITNYVVMNNTANALLAAGASPIMAHAQEEVKEMVQISSALVVNIGTLEEAWIQSMEKAFHAALQSGKPIVLDPVGAGATSLRNSAVRRLLSIGKPQVIRGNASEIMAVMDHSGATTTKGVDSVHSVSDAKVAAQTLSANTGAIICVSGATDLIVHKERKAFVHNGHVMMTKVTGLGCTASALIGAFVGVEKDYFFATLAAMSLLGVAGELAAVNATGPGSLQLQILDKLYNLNEDEFLQTARVEENEV